MEPTLYEQIGGEPAIEAALDRFYGKVMNDARVSVFFENTDIDRVKRKQRAFLAKAFGGPDRYDGRSLREAHRKAVANGLNEAVYTVFMGHFRDTLVELGVDEPKIERVMQIAHSGRDDVLNR